MDKSLTVSAGEGQPRLDAFLARALPGCTLRGAKRLLEQGLVMVNGRMRPAHFRLRPGNRVDIAFAPAPEAPPAAPRLLAATEGYAAFFKPAGLHTAHVSGSAAANLETALPDLWPGLWANFRPGEPAPLPPLLLTRLDAPTSGIVLAAFGLDAARRFRLLEAAGEVEKEYFAVIHGHLPAPALLRKKLDSADRKKTKALPEDSEDRTRHTRVLPRGDAASFLPPDSPPASLVAIHIRRGARHQIRAHLADAGFPLLGDVLYGPPETGGPLYLHHFRLSLPDFAVDCPPPWLK